MLQQLKQPEDEIFKALLAFKATRSEAEDMSKFITNTNSYNTQNWMENRKRLDRSLRVACNFLGELQLLIEKTDAPHKKLRGSIQLVGSKALTRLTRPSE